ncbi:MAG TPA: PilZ domain-containing protein [Humisphaera sp.]|nr:PilZ domain-containing protein [Humisphaera sp.]
MLRTDGEIFILIPEASNNAILHPGKVMSCDDSKFQAASVEQITAAVGSDVNTFAAVNGKFMQQGAKVLEWQLTEAGAVFSCARTGPIVSAEQRQIYRVSAVMAGIVAQIGKEINCQVMDVSAEGFAAIATNPLQIGTLTEIGLRFEQTIIKTTARVQTAKTLANGKVRYGFLIPDKQNAARKLFYQISGAIQRAQLKRLSGAA